MSSMAQQFLNMARAMADLDVSTLPAPLFMGALRRELMALNFSAEDAEILTTRMKIDVAAGAFTTAQLEELASSYATMMWKLLQSLEREGFNNPMRALQEVVSQMSLTAKF